MTDLPATPLARVDLERAPLHFACLRCRQQLVARAEDAGGHCRCGACGELLRIPGRPRAHGWPPVAQVERPPCPSCGQRISAAARKCHRCGEILDAALVDEMLAEELMASTTGAALRDNPARRAELTARVALAFSLLPLGLTGLAALLLARQARKDPHASDGTQRVAVAATIFGLLNALFVGLFGLAIFLI